MCKKLEPKKIDQNVKIYVVIFENLEFRWQMDFKAITKHNDMV